MHRERKRGLIQSYEKRPCTQRKLQKTKWQRKNATKNFNNTTTADRLRIQTFPLTAKAVFIKRTHISKFENNPLYKVRGPTANQSGEAKIKSCTNQNLSETAITLLCWRWKRASPIWIDYNLKRNSKARSERNDKVFLKHFKSNGTLNFASISGPSNITPSELDTFILKLSF